MITFNFAFYSLSCFTFLLLYANREKSIAKAGVVLYTLLIVIWLWSNLAFREPQGDPKAYMISLELISHLNFSELLKYEGPLGFRVFNWILSYFSISSEIFFSSVFILCIVPLYLAFRESFGKVKASTLLMIYLLYPFYLNHLDNTFKQGIASGFMIWGFSCLIDKENPKVLKGFVLLIIAILFHSSFWIALLAIVVWYIFYKRLALVWVIATLLVCIILSIANLVETIVSNVLPTQIVDFLSFEAYLDDNFSSSDFYQSLNNQTGFRLDFAIFTGLPILFTLFLRRFYPEVIKKDDLTKIYCLLASAYFLLSFIPFSDRIAAFSWFLIPFMIYSLLDEVRHKYLKTLFVALMLLVYCIIMIIDTKGYFQ